MEGIYDYAIIGGGIAGLYAAHKLSRRYPHKRLLLVESESRLGGRAKMGTFADQHVVTGAGVGRKHKDKRLQKLMSTLNVKSNEFGVTHTHWFPCELKDMFLAVKHAYESHPDPKPEMRFKEFAEPLLGKAHYERFLDCAGYTDFQNADVAEVLFDYGFDDNYSNWQGLSVPWAALIDALKKDIHPHCEIARNTEIRSLQPVSNCYILFSDKSVYQARIVVVATAIDSIRKLLPQALIYNFISGQPFLRLYAKFDKPSSKLLSDAVADGMNIVSRPIQKIIPMNRDAGVYMIAYCDNENALLLEHMVKNTPKNRSFLSDMVCRTVGLPDGSLRITSQRGYFFENGTHYFKPLNTNIFKSRNAFLRAAQRPLRNVYVVGEVVARNHGWTEGALKSVDAVFR